MTSRDLMKKQKYIQTTIFSDLGNLCNNADDT